MEEWPRDHDLHLATLKTKIVVLKRQITCKKVLQVGIGIKMESTVAYI